ncbi:hypothetical protein ZIOFF_048330 [Zingiber officinale]|uniref:Uncharacterized protein n=1 Tax=Zingiber officinale TaxID=94328 RepID=A0A8J5FPI1_ZINOF|nr:hypothetical protein ZIOFF_048330 [Zingiber officinale]
MNSTSLNHLEFDYLFKLLLSGNSRVVKSNHLLRFTSDSFEDIFPTIGSLLVLVVDPFSLFASLSGNKMELEELNVVSTNGDDLIYVFLNKMELEELNVLSAFVNTFS